MSYELWFAPTREGLRKFAWTHRLMGVFDESELGYAIREHQRLNAECATPSGLNVASHYYNDLIPAGPRYEGYVLIGPV